MRESEIKEFRQLFPKIVWRKSQVSKEKLKIKQLHIWDKNGSHEKAIKAELKLLDFEREQLKLLLNGKTYEEMLELSKKLTTLQQRLKRSEDSVNKINITIEKIKKEISEL